MSVRGRHLVAYAASMISLILLQIFFFTDVVDTWSDARIDLVYTLFAEVVCMGIVPLVALLLLRRKTPIADTFRTMRFTRPKDFKATALATLGIMLLIVPYTMLFNAVTNLLLEVIGYKRAASVGAIYGGVGDFFIQLALVAVLPAVFEEFTHRGVLLSGMENRGSEFSAIVWSSLLFGLMHQNPLQMIYATFGGFVFGLLVIKTGSVFPAMCAHFANNAISTFIDYSTQRGTAFGKWYDSVAGSSGVLSLLLTVAVLAFATYGIISILQYLSRKCPKPISERKFFGVITVDDYKPDGKATLRDNICLYAVVISESLLLVVFVLWGILR